MLFMKKNFDCMVEGKGNGNESVFKVTCFMDEEPNILFPLLLPLRFTWLGNQSIVWKNESTEFLIVPFSRNGREMKGYRIHFKGSPEAFHYLFDQSVARFNPIITAIEWVHVSNKTQNQLVGIAEQHDYRRCTQYGLYEKKDVSVILLPSSEIHLQYRDKRIHCSQVPRLMEKMQNIASIFMEKPMGLFAYSEDENFQWQ